MIVLRDGRIEGKQLPEFGYIRSRGPLGRRVLRLTRWLRARHALRYMGPAERHLDIGCGDGYFLRRSPAREGYGLDRLIGDEVTNRLDFPDAHFHVVTMLAVLEHLDDPEAVVRECARVLVPGGRLILTTPRHAAEALIKLYVRELPEEHKGYFDKESIEKLAPDVLSLTGSHRFVFGLNQVFCLTKKG